MNTVGEVKKYIADGGISAIFVPVHRDIELFWRKQFTGHESVFIHFFCTVNERCDTLYKEFIETTVSDIGVIKSSSRKIKRFDFPGLVNGVPIEIEKPKSVLSKIVSVLTD